jgi:hypothetical protein
MKKNKLSLIAVLTLATAITFNSCEKIEEGSPVTVNTSKTATISGMVHADLMMDERFYKESIEGTNFNYSDTLEYAPAGTEIHFHVVKQDMNSDVEDGSDEFRYSTTVNANGTYSINIPTTEEGLNVDISFDDFEYNYKSWEVLNSDTNTVITIDQTTGEITETQTITFTYASNTERRTYESLGFNVEVHENENFIHDFQYIND